MKICRFPEFKIKLTILQLQYLKSYHNTATKTFAALVATFSKRTALSSRNYVPEQGMSIPDLSKKLLFFEAHSSTFALEKQL